MNDDPINVPNSTEEIEDLNKKMEREIKAGGRGKETLFRVTLGNQVDQIAIADHKANLIIGINTIIISLIVAGLGSGMSFTNLKLLQFPQVIAPLTILLITCTASAAFSILAAKPRLITKKGVKDPETTSMLFFGNFSDLSLKEYVDEMYDIIKSPLNIYRSLIIDIYFNGQVLNRKYKLLAYSYLIFFIGLITCVVVYLVLAQIT